MHISLDRKHSLHFFVVFVCSSKHIQKQFWQMAEQDRLEQSPYICTHKNYMICGKQVITIT